MIQRNMNNIYIMCEIWYIFEQQCILEYNNNNIIIKYNNIIIMIFIIIDFNVNIIFIFILLYKILIYYIFIT